VKSCLAILAASLLVVPCARAQVGHPPSRSPYVDLEYSQSLSLFGGYYAARADPAGVAPGSGPQIGLHYQWRATGPANLTAEISRIGSSRVVLNPANPPATRVVGDQSWPIYTASAGLGLGLTGAKSWHSMVPEITAGLGFQSDFRQADVGGFKYGTRFAISWGAALRYITGGRYALRVDLNNRLSTVAYPPSYYLTSPTSGAAILSQDTPKSIWRNNTSITLGLSYQYSR
jgi:hypothetical protein